jgi:DnaJ family protein B protein 12
MEVNKGEAEKCKTIGASALKQAQYDRAVKFFKKSLHLYPLPGVETLLSTAERMAKGESSSGSSSSSSNNMNGTSSSSSSSYSNNTSTSSSTTSTGNNGGTSSSSSPPYRRPAPAPSSAPPPSTTPVGESGRAYTQANVEIVKKILHAKEGGRGAHYRVLGIDASANESEIKKAYRKLAIKVHPDKNSAPKSDDAFKAVGLAYATLSDSQKRTIYDRYGEEDPDNRGGGGGGGMRRGPGGMHFRPGQEVNPEDIFNMFFGGGMGGGGMHRGPGGVHFSTNFGGGMPRQQQRRRAQGQGQQQQQQQQQEVPGMANLIQLLPFLVIMILSFFGMSNDANYSADGGSSGSNKSPGLNRYFTLSVSFSYLLLF